MTIFAIRAYQGATKLLNRSLIVLHGFLLVVGLLTSGVFVANYEQCVILLGDLFEINQQHRIMERVAVKK